METETIHKRGFSKSLKQLPFRAKMTVHDPETDEAIGFEFAFRRMTDGEMMALGRAEAERRAIGQTIGIGDMLETLAPLLCEEPTGVDDWPAPEHGTLEQRFRFYFGATTDDEDLELEGKLLQSAFYGYCNWLFRLLPVQLVEAFSLLVGSHAPGNPSQGNGARSDVRLPALHEAGERSH